MNRFHLLTGMFACFALTAMLASSANASPIVMNGSFEDVQISSPYNSTNPADIPGWVHTGSGGDALLWAVGYSDCCGSITTAGSGNQFVTLGGGYLQSGSASWSTTITGLTPGLSYDLNFMTATEQGPNFPGPQFAQTMTVGFSSGSSTTPQSFTSPLSSADYWRTWVNQHYEFLASASSATVDFSVTNQGEDMGLDAVSVSAVPEPASLLMFAGGLLGAAAVIRRKMSSR